MTTRYFSRLKINNDIEALAPDGLFRGILENISLGGLFIKTKKCIRVGEQVEINLPLRSDDKTINFSAKLVAIRNDGEGIAFAYNDLDHHNFWTLQSFLIAMKTKLFSTSHFNSGSLQH